MSVSADPCIRRPHEGPVNRATGGRIRQENDVVDIAVYGGMTRGNGVEGPIEDGQR